MQTCIINTNCLTNFLLFLFFFFLFSSSSSTFRRSAASASSPCKEGFIRPSSTPSCSWWASWSSSSASFQAQRYTTLKDDRANEKGDEITRGKREQNSKKIERERERERIAQLILVSLGLKGAAAKAAADEPKIVPLRSSFYLLSSVHFLLSPLLLSFSSFFIQLTVVSRIKRLNIVGKSIFREVMDSPASAVDLGSLDTLFSVVKKRQPTKGKRRREGGERRRRGRAHAIQRGAGGGRKEEEGGHAQRTESRRICAVPGNRYHKKTYPSHSFLTLPFSSFLFSSFLSFPCFFFLFFSLCRDSVEKVPSLSRRDRHDNPGREDERGRVHWVTGADQWTLQREERGHETEVGRGGFFLFFHLSLLPLFFYSFSVCFLPFMYFIFERV